MIASLRRSLCAPVVIPTILSLAQLPLGCSSKSDSGDGTGGNSSTAVSSTGGSDTGGSSAGGNSAGGSSTVGGTTEAIGGASTSGGASSEGGASGTGGTTATSALCADGSSRCVQDIIAGNFETCAILNGAAYCWGWNYLGQLGNNSAENSPVPVPVTGLTAGVTAIAIGGSGHSCAVADGRAYCWGDNAYGELGNNTTALSRVPVPVSGLTSGVTSVACSNNSSFAVASGAAYCWGDNQWGQLGWGHAATETGYYRSLVPAPVSVLTAGVDQLTASIDHTCATASDAAYCWGHDASGVLGNGSIASDNLVPVQVSGLSANVTDISVAFDHACAVVGGAVYCWGSNGYGQLGTNKVSYSTTPLMAVASGATAVGTGFYHSCALVSGSVRCWGGNDSGALGNNSTLSSSSSVQVDGLTANVTAIAVGSFHSCALVNEHAFCWGNNQYGALGNNSTTDSLVPVEVQFP